MRRSGEHPGFDDQLFYTDFRKHGSVFLFPGILIGASFMIVGIAKNDPSWPYVSLVIIGVATAFWLTLRVMAARTPVGVGSEGLRCQNRVSKYVNCPWVEILTADRTKIFGAPYLILNFQEIQSTSVPLWIEDWPGFCAAIRTHAPPDCPMLACLD